MSLLDRIQIDKSATGPTADQTNRIQTNVERALQAIRDLIGAKNGIAPLDKLGLILATFLGTGVASATTFLRGDRVWAPVPGRLVRAPQVLTAGTTYSRPVGVTAIYVECIGGGAGGGGTTSVAASDAAGGGGGSGGYAAKYYSNPPATCTIAIGAGGAGGAATGAAGGGGGNTTFTDGTTLITAGAGTGGAGMAAGVAFLIAQGGFGALSGINGDLNGGGANGGYGLRANGAVGGAVSGAGGDSIMGGAGLAVTFNGTGFASVGFGSGGSGGCTINGGAAVAGGAGSAGVIRVWEFS